MKKSVMTINPKVKEKEKKYNYLKVLMIIQFILTISLIVLGIITVFNNDLLYVFELVLGITLIDMGINNYLIYKRNSLTILYLIIGLGSFVLAIMGLLGI